MRTVAPVPAAVEVAEAETLISFPTAATATKIGGGIRNVQGLTILTNHRPSTNGEIFREAGVLAGSLLLSDSLTQPPWE